MTPIANRWHIPSPLVNAFKRTTASYKYLFFKAVVDSIAENPRTLKPIPLSELADRMVALAWYPIKHFRLSFGPGDSLEGIVNSLRAQPNQGSVTHHNVGISAAQTTTLLRYVPFRLLSVWFDEDLKGTRGLATNRKICQLATTHFDRRKPLYKFVGSGADMSLVMHEAWVEYIDTNQAVLMDWINWNFLKFLRRHNQESPSLEKKLFRPYASKPSESVRKFWRLYAQTDKLQCIYSSTPLSTDITHLDHYIPHSFVCHDEPWNLIPVSDACNLSKSDKTPHPRYDHFLVALQFRALNVARNNWTSDAWQRFAGRYCESLRCSLDDLSNYENAIRAYENLLAPLRQTAIRYGYGQWEWNTTSQ